MSPDRLYQPDINTVYSLWELIPDKIDIKLNQSGNPQCLLKYISERFDALCQEHGQPLIVINKRLDEDLYGAVMAADVQDKWIKFMLQPVGISSTIVIWGNFPSQLKEPYMVHFSDDELLKWALISPLTN